MKPPGVLAEKVVLARSDADAFIRASSAALDRMPQTLPQSMPFQDFAQFAGELDAQLRPKGSAMEASMSELAGGPCSPTVAVRDLRATLGDGPSAGRTAYLWWSLSLVSGRSMGTDRPP